MLIAGLDEAGRGPVLGPLVIGCIALEESKLSLLDALGVDDSKKLTPKKREFLAMEIKKIANYCNVVVISPSEINHLHDNQKLTLNQIEEMHFAKCLNNMVEKPQQIFLDACDVKEERFGQSIGKLLSFTPNKIISKHKGDAIFTIVGAASIVAKYERDLILRSYVEEYGKVGSGYPADPNTKSFLDAYYREHKKFPPIVRTWWKTAQNIVVKYDVLASDKKQKKITDFN